MSFEPFVAAAVQMVSGSDVSENLAAAAGLIEEAAAQDARLIVLPENFAIMGRDRDRQAQSSRGRWRRPDPAVSQRNRAPLRRLARRWIGPLGLPPRPRSCATAASFMTIAASGSHVTTRSICSDSRRAASGIVRPIRSSRDPVRPSPSIRRLGASACQFATTSGFRNYIDPLGRSTSSSFRRRSPSLLDERTGKSSLRARAIENQAYVIAPAQGGEHPRWSPDLRPFHDC